MIGVIWDLITWWFWDRWTSNLSRDYRNDPAYKKNVSGLIERHREFEKKE
ncbi:hypothetical protein SAMN05444123_104203 [Rhodopseudomonas pseudopalustris]|uniref:Uncharacterized protein n=1 Tax=Rhodopseudomonas pseudopalustris TaxID=1513892 RepID=A0A1H8S1K4_9BRAD|nr:hypothetical protein SAMN05444123_104203 [Rhodopseudomonas pseudopalustris]